MTQDQLIKTPKTMLDWFAENKVQIVGMDIPFDREISIMGGHAKIELDEATGRGKHSYYFWNEEGAGMEIEYGELNSAEAVALAKIVSSLEELLSRPYPAKNEYNKALEDVEREVDLLAGENPTKSYKSLLEIALSVLKK